MRLRRGRRRDFPAQTANIPPDAAADANRLREAVLKAIRSLPELERTAMLLYFYEGLRPQPDRQKVRHQQGLLLPDSLASDSLLATALAGVPEAFGVEVGQ